MTQLSRRSFLASSVRAALFGATASSGIAALGQSTPWSNWSGGQHCQPQNRIDVTDEEELVSFLLNTRGPIRPVGSGHSFSPLVPTDGNLIVIDQLRGIIDHDDSQIQAVVGAGSRLGDLGDALNDLGQGMINLPDIDRQTLAGAIATSTHGTGVELKSLSSFVDALRLITPRGEIMDIDASDEDLFNAARVNLGALGIVTQVRLQNRARYRLKKREWAAPTEDILATFDDSAANHRHFEIFPLVYSDYSLALSIEETDEPIYNPPPTEEDDSSGSLSSRTTQIVAVTAAEKIAQNNAMAQRIEPTEAVDWSHKLLSNVRYNRFNEMEYSVPAEVGAECLREILQTIIDQEIDVAFPLEYRYVSGDDLWLSMSYGAEPHAAISIHQSAAKDHRPYFDIIEPIFWKYGGRPHWGKLHSLTNDDLAALYPRFNDFKEVRKMLDPDGRLLNYHLRMLFDVY